MDDLNHVTDCLLTPSDKYAVYVLIHSPPPHAHTQIATLSSYRQFQTQEQRVYSRENEACYVAKIKGNTIQRITLNIYCLPILLWQLET